MWKFLSIVSILILAAATVAVGTGYDLRTLLPTTAGVTVPQKGEQGAGEPVTDTGQADVKAVEPGEQATEQESPASDTTPSGPASEWTKLVRQTTDALQREAPDEAEQHLDALANMEPASRAAESKHIAELRRQLDEVHRIIELRAAVVQLVAEDPEQAQAAENLLFERVDKALPLLEEALRGDDVQLACHVMAMLQRLKRPDETLPMIVDVLRRPEQAACWPEAIRHIGLAESDGVGDPLLKLALAAETSEQRIAALEALAVCVDPPQYTVLALLPLLYADGPELAAALRVCRSVVVVHNQTDLWVQWAADGLTSEQTERLFKLTNRLGKISGAPESEESADRARAARELAMALRQLPAEPLTGVKIAAYGAESDDGRAATVLDGTWDTVDPKLMWRYSTKEPHSIVFDLGTERTIAGVRIWNLNEPQGAAGGWKQVAVYVGSGAAELTHPAAKGIVPQGPATKNAPDYGTTIPVRFAHGRYVRLAAESLWSSKPLTGLTEVQLLGF
ncbi:MAG: DUF4457 domain-containing protein [Planctomycetes bacterium]|nr:DUF4457 domain-containing protein [Planctomycetota bacterium]MBL7038453.1 DUF4457 domain-containing protein [Pirellulaceae bacterium]